VQIRNHLIHQTTANSKTKVNMDHSHIIQQATTTELQDKSQQRTERETDNTLEVQVCPCIPASNTYMKLQIISNAIYNVIFM
jgi:hypothetical protein